MVGSIDQKGQQWLSSIPFIPVTDKMLISIGT